MGVIGDFVFFLKHFKEYRDDLNTIKRRLGPEVLPYGPTFEERVDRLEIKLKSANPNKQPLPKGLNSLAMLAGSALTLSLSCYICLAHQLGLEVFYDFAAYVFPFLAALVAGLGVITGRDDSLFYWVSSIFLFLGVLCYVLSKGVEILTIFPVTLGVLLISSIVGLLYDEISNKKSKAKFIDKFSIWVLAISLIVAIPGSFIYVLLGFSMAKVSPNVDSSPHIRIVTICWTAMPITIKPSIAPNDMMTINPLGVRSVDLPWVDFSSSIMSSKSCGKAYVIDATEAK